MSPKQGCERTNQVPCSGEAEQNTCLQFQQQRAGQALLFVSNHAASISRLADILNRDSATHLPFWSRFLFTPTVCPKGVICTARCSPTLFVNATSAPAVPSCRPAREVLTEAALARAPPWDIARPASLPIFCTWAKKYHQCSSTSNLVTSSILHLGQEKTTKAELLLPTIARCS